MHFKTPLLLILIPIVLVLVWFFRRAQQTPGFRFSSAQLFQDIQPTLKARFSFIPFLLRLLALGLFLFALAGPRHIVEETTIRTEGIDIVLAIDGSTSMMAEDFKINGKRKNRLAVVKKVVEGFIDERKNDKIGLIVFGGRAYTVCPLTTDYEYLKENLSRIDFGLMAEENSTAIGSALSSGLARLKRSEAKSKIIILLTDGISNAGKVDPMTAAQLAQSLGIKVYTIGAGSKGMAPIPIKDFFGRTRYVQRQIDLDENTLKAIADTTEGQYFRATDTASLKNIYSEIDKLEKTEIEETGFREFKELFWIPLALAFLVLLLEVALANTYFLKIP